MLADLAASSEGEAIARTRPARRCSWRWRRAAIPGRNGCPPAEVPALVASLRGAGLDVRGLMVVAPRGPPRWPGRHSASRRELAHDLGLPELSMGMTDDLEVALSEGSTMVRVGRALFGERPLPPGMRDAVHGGLRPSPRAWSEALRCRTGGGDGVWILQEGHGLSGPGRRRVRRVRRVRAACAVGQRLEPAGRPRRRGRGRADFRRWPPAPSGRCHARTSPR